MQVRLELRASDAIEKIIQSAGKDQRIWAISGSDPLLTGEAADGLRMHFKATGITERQVEVPDRSFDWKGWLAAAGTASLFSDQRLMDLRLPTGKPGIEGSKAIQAWCANRPRDVALLVLLPRADKAMLSSSWYTALDQAGVVVLVPELYRSDLPNWMSQRLRAAGLTATPDAIAWLCDQCEGNLMAAHQEILKIALHHEQKDRVLDLDDLKTLITDVARFSPFLFSEAILTGDAGRAVRVLRGLKSEAAPLPLILWSLAEDLRMLAKAQQLLHQGRSSDAALREARIPRAKERLIAGRLRQSMPQKTWKALRQTAEVDTIIKGLKNDDPWIALERLAIEFA
jgi:DNA polymerase-3 subunit delta